MAIIWSLIPIRNTIVLEYGPAGTTHFGGGMYSSLGLELENSLFTTHISEDDVIMGDVSRLEAAIEELDAAYAPKVIFVVASAVIAVIGTDIKGVCARMQDRVNARLIAFDDGGFRGDYTFGLRAVYRLLAKNMIENRPRREKRYLILGASAGAYRIRSDVWEIKNLMREAFGWECCFTMGLETDVEEMRSAGGACLSLVLRTEALEAAEYLKEEYGIPFAAGAPYGYLGTLAWLQQISAIIGERIDPVLRRRLEDKAAVNRPFMGGPMGSTRRKEATAAVWGDYDLLLGLRQALAEMEINVTHAVCAHSLKAIQEPDKAVERCASERERMEIFSSLRDHWILGSDETRLIAGEGNYFTLVSAPLGGKAQTANHLPFMGEKGMDYLMECKEEYFDAAGI